MSEHKTTPCRDCGGPSDAGGRCVDRDCSEAIDCSAPQHQSTMSETLLLLTEAISLGRRDGMAGQHLGAMCCARDEIERLRAALRRIAETGPPAEYERIAREALGDV